MAVRTGGKKSRRTPARYRLSGLLKTPAGDLWCGGGNGELPISSEYAVAIDSLPSIHKDPFDRLLVAQATVEGMTLLTSDGVVAQYPGPVRSAEALRSDRM